MKNAASAGENEASRPVVADAPVLEGEEYVVVTSGVEKVEKKEQACGDPMVVGRQVAGEEDDELVLVSEWNISTYAEGSDKVHSSTKLPVVHSALHKLS